MSGLNRNGINWKIITPSVFIIVVIILFVYFISRTYIEGSIYESARKRANEIAEIINISIEADSSLANLTRTNNSVATFEDVNNLFILDPERQVVVASSDYYLAKKDINNVELELYKKLFLKALEIKNNHFYQKEDGDYIYFYYLTVREGKGLSFKKYLLIIDFNSFSLNQLFEDHLNSLMVVFFLAVLLSMMAIYIRTEKIVISPLQQLLSVIDKGEGKEAPPVFKYKSNDELGKLVDMYNAMVVNEHQQKKALIEEKEKSDAAAKAKGNFLSVMSHEIRTPMNGVVGGCAFLEDTILTEDQKRHTRMIRESSQQLLALVNDVLDFSKIESGKVIIENNPFDLVRTVKHVLILFEQNIFEKSLSFDLVEPDEPLPTLLGDELRIKQVLINLISNAIKFTTEGSISVRLNNVNRKDESVAIVIEVEDTGIGIEKEKAEELFNSFTQADATTTRKFGGTGLGLAISKQLTEIMGGHIWFESEIGKGTRFFVQLELEITDQGVDKVDEGPANGEVIKMMPSTIMLVEDTEVNRLIATEILEGLGHKVLVAENGQEAVDTYQNEQAQIDLILMDCSMPVMDGYEASRQIRAIEAQGELHMTPIIALTADVTKENQQKCQSAGMNDFMVKPYEPHTLITKLSINLG